MATPAGAPLDDVVVRCTTGLVRAESVVSAALDPALRAHGITGAGFNVLMILEGAGEPLCPRQISDRRLVSRGTTTGVLDSLEGKGLITREPHPVDGRSLLVDLTVAGRDLLARVVPDVRIAERVVLAHLSAQDQARLADILDRLEPPR